MALDSEANEILYGGAAGGGKSFLMRSAAIIWCTEIPGLQVYIFRRIREDLVKNHVEGPKGFRALLAATENAGWCQMVEDEIRFHNGSKIYLCHCKDAKDIYKYQGAEIHVLLIDELTHWTDAMYRFLRNRVRMVGINLPAEYEGKFPRILCSANPGNIGHQFVKSSFIDKSHELEIVQMPPDEGGMLRQYIPARLDDNPSMETDDPGYEGRLSGLGSEALVRAMRDGDWSVVEGAFFDCWEASRHVVRPFAIPEGWLRFRSMDWGFAKPFSVGWWAVVEDDYWINDKLFPRGAIIRYREWYGCEPGKPDTGIRYTAEMVADGILERERNETIAYGVIDPAAYQHTSGPSIAETMMARGVINRRADNTRVGPRGAISGWDAMRARLVGEGEYPMMFVFSTCRDFIRTVPTLQHDPDRPEDLLSSMEDHCFAAGTRVKTPDGFRNIEALEPTGVIASIDGWRLYRSARIVARDQLVVRMRFSDGLEVVCTPDHKFLNNEKHWKDAIDFADETSYVSSLWNPKSSRAQFRNLTAPAITAAGITFREKVSAFTARCGNALTAQSRRDIIFTTETTTGQTTGSRTSSFLPCSSTWAVRTAMKRPSAGVSPSERQPRPLGYGTGPRTASAGIASTTISICVKSTRRAFQWFASIADRILWETKSTPSTPSFAGPTAGPVRCVSVERLLERRDVYCLTVPDTGNFALENGAIVANCADESRYACLSRPWIPKPKLPPPQKDLIYEVQPDGRVSANMGVRERVTMLEKKRKRDGRD